jgi:hypothetical protein
MATKGVMDHGRQPMDVIIREKYMSNFHLYLSSSDTEIDCITIKESIITGAIPLISTYGIFKEREGLHFDLGDGSPMAYGNIALKILEIMKDPTLDIFRENLKKSNTIISWNDISARWLQQLPC